MDSERTETRFVDGLLTDLRWLGLDWDGPPQVASDAQQNHERAVQQLWDRGVLYPCVCSRGEVLRALGAPQEPGAELRYPGTCRDRYASMEEARQASGKPAALRLRVPTGVHHVNDLIFGHHQQDLAQDVGDFVIQRRSSGVAYQLSCVVDDDLCGVTHVVRGRDLLDSTLRQNLVARELGLNIPHYAHVPLICDHEGRRLAKRAAALSLAELRDRGITPTQIVRWAAACANQPASPDQKTARDFVEHFDLTRITPGDILLPQDVAATFEERTPRRLP